VAVAAWLCNKYAHTPVAEVEFHNCLPRKFLLLPTHSPPILRPSSNAPFAAAVPFAGKVHPKTIPRIWRFLLACCAIYVIFPEASHMDRQRLPCDQPRQQGPKSTPCGAEPKQTLRAVIRGRRRTLHAPFPCSYHVGLARHRLYGQRRSVCQAVPVSPTGRGRNRSNDEGLIRYSDRPTACTLSRCARIKPPRQTARLLSRASDAVTGSANVTNTAARYSILRSRNSTSPNRHGTRKRGIMQRPRWRVFVRSRRPPGVCSRPKSTATRYEQLLKASDQRNRSPDGRTQEGLAESWRG